MISPTIGAGHEFITLHPLLVILILGPRVPIQDSALSYIVMTGTRFRKLYCYDWHQISVAPDFLSYIVMTGTRFRAPDFAISGTRFLKFSIFATDGHEIVGLGEMRVVFCVIVCGSHWQYSAGFRLQ
ncbi:MAG: hypothetical protein AB8G17_16970 [Gammaproteobacteria bacterium]